VNDMHYAATQHLADAAIDPADTPSGFENPFVPGEGGSSPSYTGKQAYVIPISLGALPGPNARPGCAISSFEEDNLLDATQRHLSMDWNINAEGPSVNTGLSAHVVDTPSHSNPNTAGSLMIRNYLSPQSCTGSPGTCSASPAPSQPYLIVRDSKTGCAYPAQAVANYLLNDPNSATSPLCNLAHPGKCPTAETALVSLTDPSDTVSGWMDPNQKTQHTTLADITPDACYADGDPTLTKPLPFANRVAWTRSAQWQGSEGPDDSYVGGAISSSDLGNLPSGSLCTQQKSGDGCVMRFRFRIPQRPVTPCPAPYRCSLTTDAWLRYMSLTFWYRQSASGVNPYNGISIVSLADEAFATSGDTNSNFVTLLVNVGNSPNGLPTRLQVAQGAGVTQGVQPIANSNGAYSLWTTNGYTILDLTQLSSFTPADALLMTLRNTMPSAGFSCSGAAVPFSTAEYTNVDGNGAGMMGPFAPLVDYVDPYSLPASAPSQYALPDPNYCGVLPASSPNLNAPSLSGQSECQDNGANCLSWPNQFWSSNSTVPPNLYCPAGAPVEPTTAIYFVATQFPTPVPTWESGNSENCATSQQPNACNQIVVQSPQTTDAPAGSTWQPPLPLTIVGTGFGALPGPLPFVGAASSLKGPGNSQLLTITDEGNGPGGIGWSTSGDACQVYIANWTDSGIALVVNLPVGVQNYYQQLSSLTSVLSPLGDYSPLTFLPPSGCPVVAGDTLEFTVTNPQNGHASGATTVTVSQAGVTLF